MVFAKIRHNPLPGAITALLIVPLPGAITALLIVVFIGLDRVLQGDSLEGVISAIERYDRIPLAVELVGGFTVLAGGFALIIYCVYEVAQHYFVLIPWRKAQTNRAWVRSDRGAQVLRCLEPAQLRQIKDELGADLRLDGDGVLCPAGGFFGKLVRANVFTSSYIDEMKEAGEDPFKDYKRRYTTHWDALAALIEMSEDSPAAKTLKLGYRTNLEEFHALGIYRTGVVFAWSISTFVVGVSLAYGGDPRGALLAVICTFAIAVLLFFLFHFTRGARWMSMQGTLAMGLRALFNRQSGLDGA
jgi:hypothetical protein